MNPGKQQEETGGGRGARTETAREVQVEVWHPRATERWPSRQRTWAGRRGLQRGPLEAVPGGRWWLWLEGSRGGGARAGFEGVGGEEA